MFDRERWPAIARGLGVAALVLACAAGARAEISVEVKGAALAGRPLHLVLEIPQEAAVGGAEEDAAAQAGIVEVAFAIDGRLVATRPIAPGASDIVLAEARVGIGRHALVVRAGDLACEARFMAVPAWLSVLPPVVAIGLALAFKNVLLSLFLGILSGTLILHLGSPFPAFGASIDPYIRHALADPDHAAILIFSSLLGGMVGMITRNGGTHGIVKRLAVYATTARRGQIATWLMGIFIFFDDYANTLLVGSTMRPVSDRLRISREKLAYIVDSTAAPVASLFPISTWIGFEVGLIAGAFAALDVPYDPYTTFLASIPYRFYPIFALVLGFAVAWMGRDLGPMLRAERRARRTGALVADGDVPLSDFSSSALAPPEGTPYRARNAFLPILVVIGVTIAGLWITGSKAIEGTAPAGILERAREVFSNADSYAALLWASLAGVGTALLLSALQPTIRVAHAVGALVEGFKSMVLALVVLILAWALGAVCADLHTADFLVSITEGLLSPVWIPVIVFVLSAAVSFATGTSWATMSILMPLVIPVLHALAIAGGHEVGSGMYHTLMVGTISSVLAGSVWGDHCSPISDTTIMSSMSSGCDHIAHVRTQLPYALGIAVLGMIVGDIPTAFGLSPWVSLLLGSAVIIAGVRWLGRRSAPAE